jgi:hypothetical protein
MGIRKKEKVKEGWILVPYIVLSLREHTLVQQNEMLMTETASEAGGKF